MVSVKYLQIFCCLGLRYAIRLIKLHIFIPKEIKVGAHELSKMITELFCF